MPKAPKAEIWRGGETSPIIKPENGRVEFGKGGPIEGRERDPGVCVSFGLKSKGGGTTRAIVYFPNIAFDTIASEMIKADKDAALKAFAKAILK